MLDQIKQYFREELWNFPLSQEKGFRRFWIKWLRISYLAGRGFYQNGCSLCASSLTYYTLMSVVPVLAMAFAVARGFGYNTTFKNELLNRFPDQSAAFVELFKYADAFLEQARGGVIAGIGFAFLFLTVAFLLNNLEGILNQIWGVTRSRSWRRTLSDYFAFMLIAPVFFVAGSSAFALPSSLLFLVNLIPYCLFWMLFTFIYLFMPNTKVRFRSAALSAAFAACLYVVVQWGYIYFQIGVSRYGAVYGSMAALPLFLIWVQLGWFLVLLGAEISYAHQTLEEHEFEAAASRISYHFRRLMSLWMVHLALKKGFLTQELLVKGYQIPIALARQVLQELVDCQILHEAQGGYIPAAGALEMRISDCIHALESKGETSFPFIDSRALAPFEKAFASFRKHIESSPENTRLMHVSVSSSL